MVSSFIKDPQIDINIKIKKIYKDKNIKKLLNSCCKKSRVYGIDKDSIESIKLYSIWKAILNWNEKNNFITYLYTCFRNNLYKELKKNKKHNYESLNIDIPYSRHDISFLDDLNKETQFFLKEYYLNGETLQSIAKKKNITTEWARFKVNNAVREARRVLNGV